jgi:DNA-3-methyladenine glycosylase II
VAAAIRHLRCADPSLAAVIDSHEPPAFHCPHRPFHSLVRSILYQQLAFKAAASVYSRFIALLGGEPGVLPDAVLALTVDQLRHIGVSPRKASYLHDLARKYVTGILSDSSIVSMDDRSLASMLTMVNGIGNWSVHMFMIFSLARPDVLPSADLGVRKGVQMLYGLEDVPRPSQMEKLCEQWRPYRSVAAWYMWRLIEAKNTVSVTLPVIPPAMPAPGEEFMLQEQHQHQQHQHQEQHQPTPIQMIDPVQMLPGLG